MKHEIGRHHRFNCANNENHNLCREERKNVIKEAKETLAKTKTKKWCINIWENLGWHWNLVNGFFKISKYGYKYYITISDDWNEYTISQQFENNGQKGFKDPNKAIQHGINQFKEYIKIHNKNLLKQCNSLGI